jgi:hypothetical protein
LLTVVNQGTPSASAWVHIGWASSRPPFPFCKALK